MAIALEWPICGRRWMGPGQRGGREGGWRQEQGLTYVEIAIGFGRESGVDLPSSLLEVFLHPLGVNLLVPSRGVKAGEPARLEQVGVQVLHRRSRNLQPQQTRISTTVQSSHLPTVSYARLTSVSGLAGTATFVALAFAAASFAAASA